MKSVAIGFVVLMLAAIVGVLINDYISDRRKWKGKRRHSWVNDGADSRIAGTYYQRCSVCGVDQDEAWNIEHRTGEVHPCKDK